MRVGIKETTYQRDIKSRGIVETDRRKAEEYRTKSMMMNAAKTNKEEINMIKEKLADVDTLKHDMAEIKDLLKSLINKE
jgi:DNA-binding transcriptional regulator YhcF (GntR family)